MASATGFDLPEEPETPLLNRFVDFTSRPAAPSKTGRWKSASFIIGVELAERIAFFGISTNLISYLTGPLGQSTAAAAANVSTWAGVTYLLPLVGGFIADSFLGRYRMIITASLLYIMGLGFLSLAAALHSDSWDCQNAAGKNMRCSPPRTEVFFFFLSLYLVAFAQGGSRPCVLAFAADLFDEEDQEERKAKSSLFNWWNFILVAITMFALIGLNYIQDNLSWVLAFGSPCIFMCFALLVFLLGTMTYRFPIDGDGTGSPFISIFKAFTNSISALIRKKAHPSQPHECGQLKFCNEALILPDASEEARNMMFITNDIEGAKEIAGLLPIWISCLGFAILQSQVSTLFVKQAATMDRSITGSFQIPVASMQACIEASFVIFLPIYDRILVPIARGVSKKPGGISMLQRIGTGLFFSAMSITIAAVVERKRLSIAEEYGLVETANATLPMSVWWLAPQHLVYGVADVFTLVGLQEFFYDQVPREVRSMGVALYFSIMGVGQLSSSLLVYAVAKVTGGGDGDGEGGWLSDNLNQGHLDYFYWLLGGICAAAFAGYLYFANRYVYRTSIGV